MTRTGRRREGAIVRRLGLLRRRVRHRDALDMAKGLDAVKIFSDATLAGAHACLAKSRSDVVTCIEASLGSSSSGGGSGFAGTGAHPTCCGTTGPDGGTSTCTCP